MHERPKLRVCLPLPPFLVRGEEEGGFKKAKPTEKKEVVDMNEEAKKEEEVLRVPDEEIEKAIELLLQGKLS